jgi:hypothetical protein
MHSYKKWKDFLQELLKAIKLQKNNNIFAFIIIIVLRQHLNLLLKLLNV